MLVAFKAKATFTDPLVGGQSQNFPKHLRKRKSPFHSLSAIGGGVNWVFTGVLEMRPLKQKKRMRYEITSALVDKVEELTKVGVLTLDFERVDPQAV